MYLCLIVNAAVPEKWLGRGGFFPGTGWCFLSLEYTRVLYVIIGEFWVLGWL